MNVAKLFLRVWRRSSRSSNLALATLSVEALEQEVSRDPEGIRESLERVGSRPRQSPLVATDVDGVQADELAELGLREVLLLAGLTEPLGEAGLRRGLFRGVSHGDPL